MNQKIIFLLILLFISSHSKNVTLSTSFKRNQHKMSSCWRLHSLLCPIGIGFNGIILYLFIDERKTLIKSVNVMLWMVTFYGLCISMVTIPWKSYRMSSNSTYLEQFIGVEIECLIISVIHNFLSISNIIYNSGASLIRCWYCQSSRNVKIQEDFKKDKFLNVCRFFPQVFCIIHVLNFFNFIYHNEVKKFPLMMFQACVNPYSYYSSNVMKVMPFDQCLIYLYCLVFICSNFYLYVFLNKQNERNIAKKESDVIRDRKRNFVSARTGFAGVILTFVGIFYVYFMYNFEYWTFDSFGSLDSSTKAYLIALYADGLDCIIHPCVLLSGAPSVRKALKKWNIRKIILKPCQRKERTTE